MIVTKDIEQIMIDALTQLMDVRSIFVTDDVPDGYVESERIVLHVKQSSVETYFDRCFVEVNYAVPDIGDAPDAAGLRDAERALAGFLGETHVGKSDGTWYRFSLMSHQVLKSELHCHYVNARVLFEILNVI